MKTRSSTTLVRSVAAAAALCCAGLASAQTAAPSVTLYGLVDVGVTSVSGLKAGTVTQVASGIMEGSRWGLKGTEDLGGGYKAIFTLENRFEADTGALSNRPISGTQLPDRISTIDGLNIANPTAPLSNSNPLHVSLVAGAASSKGLGTNLGINLANNLFDRQAYVGLITPVGAVLAGRMYTPAFETNAMYDIMATQSGLAAGQIVAYPAALEIRNSNAVAYRIVKDGFSGALMYGAGEVAGNINAGRLLGVNVNYKTDLFSVGLGYNTKNDEDGNKSLTSTVLGASMNMGSSTVSTMAIKIADDNPSGLKGVGGLLLAGAGITSTTPGYATVYAPAGLAVENAYKAALKQDGMLFHIGYRYVTGANTISVAFTSFNDKRAYNADVRSYGVAYTYALSKRTDLNAVLVRYDNKDTAQAAPGGNGYLGGYTASAGTDSTGLAFGVRHRF